jgi:hypothetical protein
MDETPPVFAEALELLRACSAGRAALALVARMETQIEFSDSVSESSLRALSTPPVLTLNPSRNFTEQALSVAHQAGRLRTLEQGEYPRLAEESRDIYVVKSVLLGLEADWAEVIIARELLHDGPDRSHPTLLRCPTLRSYFKVAFQTPYGKEPTEAELSADQNEGAAALAKHAAAWRQEFSRFTHYAANAGKRWDEAHPQKPKAKA